MRQGILLIFLFLTLTVKAQIDPEALTQRFENYSATWPKVKLDLMFNQEKYAPGDTAWFKAHFLTDALETIPGKQLINLQLIDDHGEVKVHFLFGLSQGRGQNQIALPANLQPGIYLVTAYSNWMKNFDPAFVFQKELVVVDKNAILRAPSSVHIKAEGGHLISGIPNQVVVQTSSPQTSIKIVDAKEKEVASSTTDINGLVSFQLTPGTSGLFARVDGDSARYRLPVIESEGCVLSLNQESNGLIVVQMLAPSHSILRKQELMLAITSLGRMRLVKAIHLGTGEKAELSVQTNNLPEGLVQLSLLDQQGDLVASRTFYHEAPERVHARIRLFRSRFHVRDKIALQVELTDEQGGPLQGEFAFSAVLSSIHDSTRRTSLSDELNVLSPLRNKFPIDRSQTGWRTTLDHRLILEELPLPWNDILRREPPQPRFAYQSVIQRSGRAFYADSKIPVPDNTQLMLYLQRNKAHYHTFATDSGKLGLAIFDVFGDDEFFYLAEYNKEEIPNVKIVWDDEKYAVPHAPPSRQTNLPDAYGSYAAKKKLIDRSYGFFGSSESSLEDTVVFRGPDFEKLAGKADINIQVHDYIIFQTMEEFIKEVIPSVFYRQNEKRAFLRVAVMEPLRALGDPVYIIDGIATRNTEFFMSLKPADLVYVKVFLSLEKLEPFSLLGKNGIILVQTKKGNVRLPLDDKGKQIEGLNPPLQFKIPDYRQSQDIHRPDFRSTLYWNASLKTDENGKANVEFFFSDDIGPVRLRIEGLTSGGKPFTATGEVVVDKD